MSHQKKLFFIITASVLYGCVISNYISSYERTISDMIRSMFESFQSFRPFG